MLTNRDFHLQTGNLGYKTGLSFTKWESWFTNGILSLLFTPEDERPDYLNVEETADLLRVSTQTVYNMIKSGRLKGPKFGREWRFLRKNLESLIQPDQAIAARNTSTQNYEKDSAILDEIRKKRNVHE